MASNPPHLTRALSLFVILAMFALAPLADGRAYGATDTNQVRVTYLRGQASWRAAPDRAWQPIANGMFFSSGAEVKTAANGRLELKLPDGSRLRMAANSQIQLAEMDLQPQKEKRFGVKLSFGRLWSKVRRTFGVRNKAAYRVQTVTAVAGVRGTTFDVRHDAQNTTQVSVFDGQVGVAPQLIDPQGPRKEIAWPNQVTEEQWEEIILSKQQRLTIPFKERPGQPESFDPTQEADEWVTWNQSRDSLPSP